MEKRLTGEAAADQEEVEAAIDLAGMSEDYKKGYDDGFSVGFETGAALMKTRLLGR